MTHFIISMLLFVGLVSGCIALGAATAKLFEDEDKTDHWVPAIKEESHDLEVHTQLP